MNFFAEVDIWFKYSLILHKYRYLWRIKRILNQISTSAITLILIALHCTNLSNPAPILHCWILLSQVNSFVITEIVWSYNVPIYSKETSWVVHSDSFFNYNRTIEVSVMLLIYTLVAICAFFWIGESYSPISSISSSIVSSTIRKNSNSLNNGLIIVNSNFNIGASTSRLISSSSRSSGSRLYAAAPEPAKKGPPPRKAPKDDVIQVEECSSVFCFWLCCILLYWIAIKERIRN